MPLPTRYNDWPEEAKARYQEVKKLAGSLHVYIEVTPNVSIRVQQIIERAESVDPGDGSMFEKAGNVIKRVFLTETHKPRRLH